MKRIEPKDFPFLDNPVAVEIKGTNFGNELQNKILIASRIQNFLLFYLCIFFTTRWYYQGM